MPSWLFGITLIYLLAGLIFLEACISEGFPEYPEMYKSAIAAGLMLFIFWPVFIVCTFLYVVINHIRK